MEFQSITLTVPTHLVPEVYAHVAELIKADQEDPAVRSPGELSESVARDVYLGGSSDHWRPFLDQLAGQPDSWVSWSTLCEAIGLTPRQASGMLGAAERRCGTNLPYEKRNEQNEYWFRMPKATAQEVHRAAAIRRRFEKVSKDGEPDNQ